jgi:hypothetical protein
MLCLDVMPCPCQSFGDCMAYTYQKPWRLYVHGVEFNFTALLRQQVPITRCMHGHQKPDM